MGCIFNSHFTFNFVIYHLSHSGPEAFFLSLWMVTHGKLLYCSSLLVHAWLLHDSTASVVRCNQLCASLVIPSACPGSFQQFSLSILHFRIDRDILSRPLSYLSLSKARCYEKILSGWRSCEKMLICERYNWQCCC